MGTQFLELLINLELHLRPLLQYCPVHRPRDRPKDDLIRVDTHAYMHAIHHGESEAFDAEFRKYREKYYAPIENL